MFSKTTLYLSIVIFLLGVTTYGFYKRCNRLQNERDTYNQNTHSLLSDLKRIQVDSIRMAADVKVLSLTLDEYEEYRSEDLEIIKSLKAEVKRLQVVAKHELEVRAPISTSLRDTIILRDTTVIPIKAIEINTPYLQINGIVDNDRITGEVFLPVRLLQAVWIEPKHRFLWWKWGIKAMHQTITSDNPYVQITYTEYIHIQK